MLDAAAEAAAASVVVDAASHSEHSTPAPRPPLSLAWFIGAR